MVSGAELLLNSYKQLIELFEKQLSIANQERYDDQLTQIIVLEKDKKDYQSAIDQFHQNQEEFDAIITVHRSEIKQYIERLQAMTVELQRIINSWYRNDSQTMKQVSLHRKTLLSYGGVNRSDIISYYFDEKQ